MKILNLTLFVFLVVINSVNTSAGSFDDGDKKEYDIKNIPEALMKDADAVIRKRNIRFEVKDERRAAKTVKMAVTVFKKEERDYGYLGLGYDKYSKIENLEGKIFDSNGNEIRELESEDKKDNSAVSGSSLFDDSRVCIAEMYYDRYPYTIEYTFEYSYDGYLNWPAWQSQQSLDAVESTRFEVVIPKKDNLRFWCNNDTIKPKINLTDDKKIYIWEAKNLPKLSKDVVGDDPEDYAAIVHIAPASFNIDGYQGNMQTWKEFGKWAYSLYKGRDVLPKTAVDDIQTLMKDAADIRTKIEKIYRYMQNRTRFISVQLGIGGWQPFEASFVHQNGYGDCKALCNYMIALLKTAGITAYPLLIRSGDYRLPFINELPSNQFNHAMVCVPLRPDTIWLECTSRSIPFGYISYNTENRGALLILPDGGAVVRTPHTRPEQNSQLRKAHVKLNSSGNADVNSIVVRNGNQQNYIRAALYDETPEKRERWILNSLDVPNADMKSYSIEGLESRDTEISLSLQLAIPRYASASGKRIFFQPNLMERKTYVPPDVDKRFSPVRFSYPYLDIDTVHYTIPFFYKVESIPAEEKLESSFGRFMSKTIAIGDTAVVYTRRLEIRDYAIPAQKYSEYRKFYADIVKADRAQVVLVRKDQ